MKITPQGIKAGLAAIVLAGGMLTAHLSVNEATATSTGLINNPDSIQLVNLKLVGDSIFERCRKHFNYPIIVSSGFRNYQVNKAVHGVANSEHLQGKALDMIYKKGDKNLNKELFKFIKDSLQFNQLIWENNGTWVHASYSSHHNRHQVLSAIQK